MVLRGSKVGSRLAVGIAVVLGFAAADAGAMTLDAQRSERIGSVDPRFVSFGIDISQMTERNSGAPFDFTRPGLLKLVKPLAPAVIRFSGTKIDQTYYDPSGTLGANAPGDYNYVLGRGEWDAALGFADEAGLDVNIGINGGPGPRNPDGSWNPDNATALLGRAAMLGQSPKVVSFGNEPNVTIYGAENPSSYTAADYATDVDDFLAVREAQAPDSTFIGPGVILTTGEERPLLGAAFGPDINAMMPLTGSDYDAVSFHQYPGFGDAAKCVALQPRIPDDRLSDEFLDRFDGALAYMQSMRDQYAPGKRLWVDEFGNGACGGLSGYSDTFAAGFYFLNELGRMAEGGVDVASRWTISGPQPYALIDDATLTPRPDYWAALLWHQLMGTTVVRPRLEQQPDGLRTYSACTPGSTGGVTSLLLNTSADPAAVTLAGSGSGGALAYAVTAGLTETTVSLNGEPLAVEPDGSVPDLAGKPISGGAITVAPQSYTFVVTPGADAFACGGSKLRLGTALQVPAQSVAAAARAGAIRADCTLDDRGSCAAVATVPGRLARRLGIPATEPHERGLIGAGSVELESAGTGSLSLQLTGRAQRKLNRWPHRLLIRVRAEATAADRRDGHAAARMRLGAGGSQ